MTDYRLMPEEATPEMEQAAEKYWNDRKFKALSDDPRTWKGLYAAMRVAAPAVQGEPVGYVRPHQLEALRSGKACGITMEDKPDAHNRVTIPLYATPQPAEQQPDVQGYVMVPAKEFESVLNRADWRTAKNRAELRHMLKALQSSAAPDVAGLVEALESLVKGYVNLLEAGKDRITSLGGDCDPVPVMEHNDPWLRDARVALAPYRKGGE